MTSPSPTPPLLEWPQRWRWPRAHRRLLWVGLGLCAALLYGAIIQNIPLMTVAALVAFVSLTIWFESRPRYRPSTLRNAVTLTEAVELPPDSWVHVFLERRRSLGIIVTFGVLGVGFVVVGTMGLVMDPIDGDGAVVWLRIVSVAVLLLGVLFVYAGIRGAIGRKRLGSFGERPLGIALGESALMLVTVTGVETVAWDSIVRVRAEQESGRGKGDNPGVMWLRLEARRPDGSAYPVMLTPEASEVHPWVTYTAITLAVTDRRFRASLGSARAQAQLDSWSAYAALHSRNR